MKRPATPKPGALYVTLLSLYMDCHSLACLPRGSLVVFVVFVGLEKCDISYAVKPDVILMTATGLRRFHLGYIAPANVFPGGHDAWFGRVPST